MARERHHAPPLSRWQAYWATDNVKSLYWDNSRLQSKYERLLRQDQRLGLTVNFLANFRRNQLPSHLDPVVYLTGVVRYLTYAERARNWQALEQGDLERFLKEAVPAPELRGYLAQTADLVEKSPVLAVGSEGASQLISLTQFIAAVPAGHEEIQRRFEAFSVDEPYLARNKIVVSDSSLMLGLSDGHYLQKVIKQRVQDQG